MTSQQQQLYKAAVQKVRDEVMAAVEAANAPGSGYSSAQAAGRNARARNLNTKYFTSDNEAAMAPIPITKRKRGRPAKKKPGEEPAIGIMDGLGLENLGMSSGTPADSAGELPTCVSVGSGRGWCKVACISNTHSRVSEQHQLPLSWFAIAVLDVVHSDWHGCVELMLLFDAALQVAPWACLPCQLLVGLVVRLQPLEDQRQTQQLLAVSQVTKLPCQQPELSRCTLKVFAQFGVNM